jgi:hypothetical protein
MTLGSWGDEDNEIEISCKLKQGENYGDSSRG